MAGAAAEAGYDLDAVEAVAARANDRTRSFGAAFDGCTLPGAEAPLFTLPEGPSPGASASTASPASATARCPRPTSWPPSWSAGSSRTSRPSAVPVAVLLNGLGSVKYEELFVLWSAVLPLLEAAGLEVVAPEVGELVTSLDMAGCSLTVSWLDDELETLWLAPADSPAFRRTAPAPLRPHPGAGGRRPPRRRGLVRGRAAGRGMRAPGRRGGRRAVARPRGRARPSRRGRR